MATMVCNPCDVSLQVPLRTAVRLNEFIAYFTRTDFQLPPVSNKVTFDIAQHIDAQSSVAHDMLKRLEEDAKVFFRVSLCYLSLLCSLVMAYFQIVSWWKLCVVTS